MNAEGGALAAGDLQFHEAQGPILDRMAHAANYNRWLLERCTQHLGDRVLDVGAGIGTFAAAVAASDRQVVALEPDPAFVPGLRTRFADVRGVEVLDADIAELAGAGVEPFDSIICFNVLEHIAEDVRTLAELRQLLRPGGRLLLVVPAGPLLYGAIDRAVGHERRYRRRQLDRRLREAGLQPEVLRRVNPVGALGWLVASRVLRREQVPLGPLLLYDRVVPILHALDRLPWPVGLSLWAVARRPS